MPHLLALFFRHFYQLGYLVHPWHNRAGMEAVAIGGAALLITRRDNLLAAFRAAARVALTRILV